jgi:hypothetical protein
MDHQGDLGAARERRLGDVGIAAGELLVKVKAIGIYACRRTPQIYRRRENSRQARLQPHLVAQHRPTSWRTPVTSGTKYKSSNQCATT